ncbi:restriction endonuclease subunit S [Vibrio campbellii]|uniref:restriction endonuclease subunit S n=1 Tax=Vibrio campbellii TaxID=680 RepID=UPI003D0EBE29
MNNLVPSLRFSEFSSEWEVVSIGALVDQKIIEKPMDGNHGNIHPKASDYVEAGIPFVMSNNIVEGKLCNLGMKYISKCLADNLQKGFAIEGDVLLTHKGTIGATALVGSLETPYIMLTPQVTYYRVSSPSELSNRYLLQAFRTPKFQSMMKRLSASGTRPYVGITEQRELLTSKPSYDEQQKIADFLTSVDTKISQLTEKQRLLKEYKKGVMQQIFSQKIRFKDEDGKAFPGWTYESIGKYLEPHNELVRADTDIPILTSSRTGLYLQERSVINEGDYGVVPLGHFTYRHMSDDLIFKFNVNRTWEKGAVSKEYPVFKTVGMDTYFLEVQLNEGKDFKQFAIQQKQGGTRTRLYFKNLKELKLKLPCLKEQQKISQFLQSIDAKIEGVAEQIEQTKQFKKGLLQQIFV